MFGKQNMADLMKQAKKMQEDMERAQQQLQDQEVEGQSGAGLVKVTMTGRHKVKTIKVDPSLKDEDLDILEDLIAAAFNDASNKVDQLASDKMGSIKDMLPAGMKLPF